MNEPVSTYLLLAIRILDQRGVIDCCDGVAATRYKSKREKKPPPVFLFFCIHGYGGGFRESTSYLASKYHPISPKWCKQEGKAEVTQLGCFASCHNMHCHETTIGAWSHLDVLIFRGGERLAFQLSCGESRWKSWTPAQSINQNAALRVELRLTTIEHMSQKLSSHPKACEPTIMC